MQEVPAYKYGILSEQIWPYFETESETQKSETGKLLATHTYKCEVLPEAPNQCGRQKLGYEGMLV